MRRKVIAVVYAGLDPDQFRNGAIPEQRGAFAPGLECGPGR
jgi:cytochrome c-type biogenesis protein CcmE